MKIFSVLTSLVILLGCKNNPHNEVVSSATKPDSTISPEVIKGPSNLSSLQFNKNYPTHETANKIYSAINFQRACEAYLLSFASVVRNNHHSLPPAGFSYWQTVSSIINEQDKQSLSDLLKPFGIEKGKPFNPSLQQKILLTEAAEIGFRMVQVIGLRHGDTSHMYNATKWKVAPRAALKGESRPLSTDEQIALALQEISLSTEVKSSQQKTSAYLFSAEDKNGQWLDGAKYYQLHIPKNIPTNTFWSLTIYDNTTWQVIHNNEPRSSFNSKQPAYLTNPDGSVDLFFGSIAPEGEGTNWIRTLPDRGWFVYLKLSDATSAFTNKSWPLGDFEEVSEKVWKGGSNRQ